MIDNAEGLTLTISPGNLRSSLAILYIKNKCEGNESSKSILKSNCHLLRQAVMLVRGLDIWGNNFPGISWNIVVIIIKYLVNTREGFPPFLWLVEKKIIFPSKLYMPLHVVSLLIVF